MCLCSYCMYFLLSSYSCLCLHLYYSKIAGCLHPLRGANYKLEPCQGIQSKWGSQFSKRLILDLSGDEVEDKPLKPFKPFKPFKVPNFQCLGNKISKPKMKIPEHTAVGNSNRVFSVGIPGEPVVIHIFQIPKFK